MTEDLIRIKKLIKNTLRAKVLRRESRLLRWRLRFKIMVWKLKRMLKLSKSHWSQLTNISLNKAFKLLRVTLRLLNLKSRPKKGELLLSQTIM